MSSPISVLVADDHVGVATVLSQALARWFEVAPSVNTLPQLSGALSVTPRPSVVLLDLQFGEQSALRLLPVLVKDCPEVAFVMHSAHWDEVVVDAALAAGACGYVHKTMGLVEVRIAIEAAAWGRITVLGPTMQSSGSRQAVLLRPTRPLSPRVRRVLGLLQQGHDRAEVAKRLGISISGVDAAKRRLRRAFGLAPGAPVTWERLLGH